MSKSPPKIQLFYFVLATGILGSCSVIDFTPMNVALHPSQPGVIVASTDPIRIDFSFEIQRSTAERITSLLSSGQIVPVDYIWSGNTVRLQPRSPLDPGSRYLLQVSGSVTAQNGSIKTVNDQVPFYFEFIGLPPFVLSTSPSTGTNLAPTQSLVVFFSQAIDPSTLTHGLSLSPGTPYASSWSSDARTLTLTPQPRWADLCPLALSFSTDLRSAQGQPLASAWAGHYWVQDGSASPAVNSALFYSAAAYQTAQASCLVPLSETSPGWQDHLGLRFNRSIDFQQFILQARIVPQISGHWEMIDPTFFLFHPDQGWNMATSYLLSVPSFKTIGGTASEGPYTFSWSTAESIPPQHVSLTLNGIGTELDVPSGDSATPPTVEVGATDQIVVTLDFDQTISPTYETTLASSSLLTPLLPLSASSAQLINLTCSATRLVLTYSLVPPPEGQKALYKVVIPGGIGSMNSTGSYLASNALFVFEVAQD
ncbi:MAG: Ig-like domain-containing protein [Spirochaetales bacterium]|nr:Ig-like domain-containing protein [Spirochaetales bacterium]